MLFILGVGVVKLEDFCLKQKVHMKSDPYEMHRLEVILEMNYEILWWINSEVKEPL